MRTERLCHQDIFIDLTLVNIGGERAAGVSFEIEGEFRRHAQWLEKPLSPSIGKWL